MNKQINNLMNNWKINNSKIDPKELNIYINLKKLIYQKQIINKIKNKKKHSSLQVLLLNWIIFTTIFVQLYRKQNSLN